MPSDLAARSFEKAVALNPSVAGFYFNLGSVYSAKAKFELLTATACESSPQKALGHYRKSIEINPNFLYSYPYLAEAYLLLAECNVRSGQSPAGYLREAEPHLGRALKSGFDNAFTYALFAKREMLEARWNWKTSPATDFRQAEEYLEKAQSDRIEVQEMTVKLFQSKSEWLLEQGKSPSAALAKAFAGVDSILKANPASEEAEAIKGVLLLLQARSQSGVTRVTTIKQAAALLRNALAANKNLLPQFESYLLEAQ